MYVPESASFTEGRDSSASLVNVTSLSPFPFVVLRVHFHWRLRPRVTLLPPSLSSPPSSSSASVSSAFRPSALVGWTMWVSPSGSLLGPWLTAPLRFSLFVQTCVLLILFKVVCVVLRELSLLPLLDPFLTFTPSTVTWPLQVNTSTLPGDKTSVPGEGSVQKKQAISEILPHCRVALRRYLSLFVFLVQHRPDGLSVNRHI